MKNFMYMEQGCIDAVPRQFEFRKDEIHPVLRTYIGTYPTRDLKFASTRLKTCLGLSGYAAAVRLAYESICEEIDAVRCLSWDNKYRPITGYAVRRTENGDGYYLMLTTKDGEHPYALKVMQNNKTVRKNLESAEHTDEEKRITLRLFSEICGVLKRTQVLSARFGAGQGEIFDNNVDKALAVWYTDKMYQIAEKISRCW